MYTHNPPAISGKDYNIMINKDWWVYVALWDNISCKLTQIGLNWICLTFFLLPQGLVMRWTLRLEEYWIRAEDLAAPPVLPPGLLLWCEQFVTSQPNWFDWWAAWSRWSQCCSRSITGSCYIHPLSTELRPSASWKRWDKTFLFLFSYLSYYFIPLLSNK